MNTGKKIPKLNTKPIAANHDIVADKQTSQDHLPSWRWAIFLHSLSVHRDKEEEFHSSDRRIVSPRPRHITGHAEPTEGKA